MGGGRPRRPGLEGAVRPACGKEARAYPRSRVSGSVQTAHTCASAGTGSLSLGTARTAGQAAAQPGAGARAARGWVSIALAGKVCGVKARVSGLRAFSIRSEFLLHLHLFLHLRSEAQRSLARLGERSLFRLAQ